ncbi:MAG: DNA-binding domain-containing protein [Chthoniobacter sp.]|uniref:DNA-binding domain-containing protein n=1 Tax=Chthoniobacter sp. TaxID=2510640 RepID=UPI0032ADA8E1
MSSNRKPASLAEFQRAIAGTLFRPLQPDESMQPSGAAVAERFIKPNDRLTAFERLQIYNQQYWWRLLGSFGEDFRGLRAVLGEAKFDRLAVAYLEACGSRSWNLRDIGSQLVAFVEAHPEFTRPRTELALDVTRVEWARVLAFDDPEKPVLTAKQIAKMPADRLRLGLQPYVSLLELHHPVDEMMRTLKRTEISAVSNAVSAVHTRRRKALTARRSRTFIHLAVHRVNFAVYYKRLDPEAYHLLLALRSGATLDQACAAAFADSPEPPEQSAARIQEWFARWMEFGWFCKP